MPTAKNCFIKHGAESEKRPSTFEAKIKSMARLFTWNEIKMNGTVYPTAVVKLLNSTKVVGMRTVTENFTGTSTAYALLNYKAHDNAAPDQRFSTDAASTVNTEINTDNTTNTTETILLNVQTDAGVNSYTKYFNPRYIQEVSAWPGASSDSYVVYEEPEAQDASWQTYRVDETVSAIKSAANA